jgi:hypothetical protein
MTSLISLFALAAALAFSGPGLAGDASTAKTEAKKLAACGMLRPTLA